MICKIEFFKGNFVEGFEGNSMQETPNFTEYRKFWQLYESYKSLNFEKILLILSAFKILTSTLNLNQNLKFWH